MNLWSGARGRLARVEGPPSGGSVVELQTRERARVKESKTAPISGMIASSSPKKKMYPKQSEPAPFIAQGAIVTSGLLTYRYPFLDSLLDLLSSLFSHLHDIKAPINA